MQPRTFCFIAVFVGYAAFAFFVFATPVTVTEAPTSYEQKVLHDCKHSDYRTYISCLKRSKRHHFQHGDIHPDFDHNCMEQCVKKCDMDKDCDQKCSHCLRKTKHKHQIITEYETECISGDCTNITNNNNNDFLKSNNITTKIDIHNVINTERETVTPSTCKPPEKCETPRPPVVPPYPPVVPPYPPAVPPYPPAVPPAYPPYVPPPSFPFQLSLIPQLTLGLGLSGGGCQYPNHWPCPQTGWSNPPGQIDCSGCGTSYHSYKCDLHCYTVQGTQLSAGTQLPNKPIPCTSPNCVGGTYG